MGQQKDRHSVSAKLQQQVIQSFREQQHGLKNKMLRDVLELSDVGCIRRAGKKSLQKRAYLLVKNINIYRNTVCNKIATCQRGKSVIHLVRKCLVCSSYQ